MTGSLEHLFTYPWFPRPVARILQAVSSGHSCAAVPTLPRGSADLWCGGGKWEVQSDMGYHMISICALSPLHYAQSSSTVNQSKEDLSSLLNKMSSSFPKVQSNIKALVQPKWETSALPSEDALNNIRWAGAKQHRALVASICHPRRSEWDGRQFPLEHWPPRNSGQSRQHQTLPRASAARWQWSHRVIHSHD